MALANMNMTSIIALHRKIVNLVFVNSRLCRSISVDSVFNLLTWHSTVTSQVRRKDDSNHFWIFDSFSVSIRFSMNLRTQSSGHRTGTGRLLSQINYSKNFFKFYFQRETHYRYCLLLMYLVVDVRTHRLEAHAHNTHETR